MICALIIIIDYFWSAKDHFYNSERAIASFIWAKIRDFALWMLVE